MIESILNGITPADFGGYVFYALLGVLLSYLTEYNKSRKAIKKAGGFQIAVWIKENWVRSVLNLLAIFIGIVFMDKFNDGTTSNFGAFMLGIGLDVMIDRLIKIKQ